MRLFLKSATMSTLYERTGDEVRFDAVIDDLFVRTFKNLVEIEERSTNFSDGLHATANDMHVIEAIGLGNPQNMSTVAKKLQVTTGTLTISVNNLVKKDYVRRERSEEDRRVVLVSLTEKGKLIYRRHREFHENLVSGMLDQLDTNEIKVLEKVLQNLNKYIEENKLG